ncbi:Rhodanese-like domain-containing protein 7 [Hibiscus syriacus]|uniref:Rhodanese-like domain-containing protein 7 n=1 Tax=Hibiscus syriacus TaxID=106335 RepID=A0A6A3CV36_HIBSY|nr:rhodanese-like domain-containing protein 7 [Hibiscus syriacus]KAE8733153.1 Rhodanese-like domain-containing protein 7 [Hibiscus syriacus]
MLRCGSPLLQALRMLSSSPSSSLILCNPKLNHLPSSPKPYSILSLSSPLCASCASFDTQRMTLSKRFTAASADPIPTSDPLRPHSSDLTGSESQSLVVVSFYKFADFPDHADLRKPLKLLCQYLFVSGGIILAPEGINGSICGMRESVERVLGFIQSDDRLKGLRQIESPVSAEQEAIHHGHSTSSPLAAGEDAPFRWDHVRVKLKKEIVTLGMPDVSPIEKVGRYVSPKDWNALISDPDTVVIDVRNNYETRIGMFKGAVDPCTAAFREFPSWVEDQFQPDDADVEHEKVKEGSNESITKDAESPKQKMPKRVAMYCTGGIRCEKASSFMLSKGFDEVYHLKGGILKYLEEIPRTESLWEGECFVFDKRVAVEHGLIQGNFKLCYGCKQPVSDADMEAPEWEYGVSCPYCYSTKSEEEKERARARQRQFEAWGIIGGPDKGRRPAAKPDSIKTDQTNDSASG